MSLSPELGAPPDPAGWIEKQKEITGRQCGTCSLCCKVPKVEPDEPGGFSKPTNQWCQHCTKPGCGIYDERPQVCREFGCMWLINPAVPDHWKPEKSHIVLHFQEKKGQLELQVYVDRNYPQAWEAEPYCSELRKMVRLGFLVTPKYRTRLILGDKEAILSP